MPPAEGQVEAQYPDIKPASELTPNVTPGTEVNGVDSKADVTTVPREPMKVPAGIHVKVTQENLKDYVGP